MQEHVRRIIGALVGLVVGVVVLLLLQQFFGYSPIVVGLGIGFGVSSAARMRSVAWAVLTAVLAAAATIVAGWWQAPFTDDPSLLAFVTRPGDWMPMTWLMVAIAAVAGAWMGYGADRASVARADFCGKCGADLRGASSARCPQCGAGRSVVID